MSDTIQMKVDGMTCMHCVNAVKKALAAVDGVEAVVEVSLDAGRATVRGNPDKEALLAAVRNAGYGASLDSAELR
jgi:copper chaperone